MRKKIILEWPITVFKELQSNGLKSIFIKLPLVKKVIDRLPQKILDLIYFDDYHVTERIFEKGFVFMNLSDIPIGSKILDVGCAWSSLSLELACLGYHVWGIDIDDYPFHHPNLEFVKGSICKTDFPDNFFDVVIAVSTLEHIGLGWYGDSVQDSDIKAISEIHRILKNGGIFILTLPFGIRRTTKVFRVYDRESLYKLIDGFEIIKKEFFRNYEDKYWCPTSEKEAEKQDLNKRNRNGANVCLVLKNKK